MINLEQRQQIDQWSVVSIFPGRIDSITVILNSTDKGEKHHV